MKAWRVAVFAACGAAMALTSALAAEPFDEAALNAALESFRQALLESQLANHQVLVRVGDADLTDRVERRIQAEGDCWLGATSWRGERLLRVSVSNWSTTPATSGCSTADAAWPSSKCWTTRPC